MSGEVSVADQERREFSRFCKFFTLKMIQLVVQSRQGKKMHTCSRVTGSSSDWFNLNIDDLPEVNTEVKSSLRSNYLPDCRCVCVDVSLRTADGDLLYLECWSVSYDADVCDISMKLHSAVYHRLGMLLRSILVATRVTPTYKYYSRRQGPDSFVICYQIYSGDPQTHLLGTVPKSVNLGSVSCAYGRLSVRLTFRTEMIISQYHNVERDRKTSSVARTLFERSDAVQQQHNMLLPYLKPTPIHSEFWPRSRNNSQTSIPGNVAIGPVASPFTRNTSFDYGSSSPDLFCHTTFSASPSSGDFPFHAFAQHAGQPLQQRRSFGEQSVGSGDYSNHASSTSGGSGQHALGVLPKRDSAGALFTLELSDRTTVGQVDGNCAAVIKPSSFPQTTTRGIIGDNIVTLSTVSADEGGIYGNAVKRKTSRSAKICVNYPFAQLFQSLSAPSINTVPEAAESNNNHGDSQTGSAVKNNEQQLAEVLQIGHLVGKRLGDADEAESSDDSFVKIDDDGTVPRPAFPSQDDELKLIIRQCKTAPPHLNSFRFSSSEESLEQIPTQLQRFESQLTQFDEFVNSIRLEEDDLQNS